VIATEEMDPRSLDHYTINWTLVDESYGVVASLSNERMFDTSVFELPDGEFLLMLDLTLDQIPEYSESASTSFKASNPPKNGSCEVSDDKILIGSEISIKCNNWES
jgi:hypothetical protein